MQKIFRGRKRIMQRRYDYTFKTFRVYDMEAFRAFSEICKREYTDANKELNKFVQRVVQAGTTTPEEARRG